MEKLIPINKFSLIIAAPIETFSEAKALVKQCARQGGIEIIIEGDLEVGQKITKKAIEKQGWENIGPYEGVALFLRDDNFLFFNPETQLIEDIH